eukprot:8118804-Alexandrium_andersonii.AAC.1
MCIRDSAQDDPNATLVDHIQAGEQSIAEALPAPALEPPMRRRRIRRKQAPPEAYRAGAAALQLPEHADEGGVPVAPPYVVLPKAEKIANYLE